MTSPAILPHADPEATLVAVYTPATEPFHWQDEVEEQINAEIALGVLERVLIGELSPWCHRLVLVRKSDGTPRRTVDLSLLNHHCEKAPRQATIPASPCDSSRYVEVRN